MEDNETQFFHPPLMSMRTYSAKSNSNPLRKYSSNLKSSSMPRVNMLSNTFNSLRNDSRGALFPLSDNTSTANNVSNAKTISSQKRVEDINKINNAIKNSIMDDKLQIRRSISLYDDVTISLY